MSEDKDYAPSPLAKQLFKEARFNKSPLSEEIREQLEGLPSDIRKEEVEQTVYGYTPLSTACIRGNVCIVEYLITTCHADIEQTSKGWLRNPKNDERSLFTPLCWACKTVKLEVITCLLKNGANLNGTSECGSTPVLVACRTQHFKIVNYLVVRGANINKPNHYGETCLIASIGSLQLCKYLLRKGVDVDARDNNDYTALHHAIQNQIFQTLKPLLDYRADPFAKTRDGEDALQIACIEGSSKIADYLMGRIRYSPERKADANELLGASIFFISTDNSKAILRWKEALQIRMDKDNFIQKRPMIPSRSIYGDFVEFTTVAQLETIADDPYAMYMQSLLIFERILGMDHERTLAHLMNLAEYYQEILQNRQGSLDILLLVLQLRIQKDSILHSDSYDAVRTIVGFIMSLLDNPNYSPRFEYVSAVFQLLASSAIATYQLARTKPISPNQSRYFDCIIHFLMHLIYGLRSLAECERDHDLIKRYIRELVRNGVRCVKTRETLLHLSIQRLGPVETSFWMIRTSPSLDVVKLLLECGAHPDLPDRNGVRPSKVLAKKDIALSGQMSLKCICANAIIESGIYYRDQLPRTLENFVEEHDPQ
ncbi:protein fem-1 homolog C-like [Toxorhynchites rutilus septentrionalis]|uniref:protein fem-1 homolog C-like n=1 Tax=Toxorhynchites rutilus septentrionalis TaxID=329112 RepID=UPI00247A856A|nr:protein fem-1 homolog C-like [Toxorhynchites rutilus septentrionalis]